MIPPANGINPIRRYQPDLLISCSLLTASASDGTKIAKL